MQQARTSLSSICRVTWAVIFFIPRAVVYQYTCVVVYVYAMNVIVMIACNSENLIISQSFSTLWPLLLAYPAG